MNVLSVLVGTAARTGGTAAFVGESAAELERLGDQVAILSTDLAVAPSGWLQLQRRITADERHVALATPNVRVFPARFPRRLAFSPGLAQAAREATAASDVVHLHNLWQYPQYAGFRAARAAGLPYVVSPHGALDPFLRRRGRMRKRISMLLYQERLLREAALIHVTTDAEAELIADVAPEVPRAVVPCGIYVQRFRSLPNREDFRRARLGRYEGPLILFLGRLTYKKGLDLLLRAFARARSARPCRLVIAGPDDEGLTGTLRRLADRLGVAEHVDFVGPIYGGERLAALASADVWALPSYAENFAIAVIEAMAAGCAVAMTRSVNLAADVAAAGAGLVVEAAPSPFADALIELIELIENESGRERLRASAQTFAARYDWSAVAPRLAEMYRSAAGAARYPAVADATSAGAARAAT